MGESRETLGIITSNFEQITRTHYRIVGTIGIKGIIGITGTLNGIIYDI